MVEGVQLLPTLWTPFSGADDTGVQQRFLTLMGSISAHPIVANNGPGQLASTNNPEPASLAVNPRPNLWITFPDEILAYIFLIAVQSEPNRLANLVLSHVCVRWRAVAVRYPALWTELTLTRSDPHSPWFLLCLGRAKMCTLDISIPSSPEFTEERMSELMDLLIPRVTQWRRFVLETNQSAIDTVWERFALCESAPKLEDFSLRRTPVDDEDDGDDEEEEEQDNAENSHVPKSLPVRMAPRLRTLTLSSVSIAWASFPFTNLTYLELANHRPENQPSLSEFADIISRCPELETLILNGSGPFRVMEEFDTSPPVIDMPSLRVLEISHQTSAEEVHGLVHVLRAFYLQSLTLADWVGVDYGDAIASFGTLGFYHSITFLCIGGIEVSPIHPDRFRSQAFVDLFMGIPRVQYLTVVLHGMNPMSLAGLSSPSAEIPVVLPHLDTLKISGSHRDCVSSMVAKRKEVNAPVRRLILEKTDRLCSESFLEILAKSVDELEYVEIWDPSERACARSDYGDDERDVHSDFDSDQSSQSPQPAESDELYNYTFDSHVADHSHN